MAGVHRFGNKTIETVVRADERYGHDCLFQGPRGRDYWNMLEHPRPIQYANLYPDQHATYWVAKLHLPAGAVLTLRHSFPYCRYMQFALYEEQELGGFVGTLEHLIDIQIDPDPGSENPFRVGADRHAVGRAFTLRVVAGERPPGARLPNTLYCDPAKPLEMVYRTYLPDAGRDGSGDVGLPSYEATLADGTALVGHEVCDELGSPVEGSTAPGLSAEMWHKLLADPGNDPGLEPATTPARNPPVFERYYNTAYSLVGVFKSAEARKKLAADAATGFGGDPLTIFLMSFISRKFGPVYVMRGKMPKFPDTYLGADGEGLATMPQDEVRYWSLIMSESPPSGQGGDAVSDFQVPLDAGRNYTIVISLPEDRPGNATEDNGVLWMDWGTRGEGLPGPENRPEFGLLVMRFMACNPSWANSPEKATVPGTEAEVMGSYFPTGEYTDRATFEAKGLS